MAPSTDSVALLKALIAEPSVTPEAAGALDVVEAALIPLGFAVTRLQFSGDGSYPVDNLFALRERPGRTLLFGGHTDVVPPGRMEDWTSHPFVPREAEGRIYGRGAADMKSGIAAFIAAAARAVTDGSAETGSIALAITNDEEADSINGTDKLMVWAAERGHRFDFAIVGEPSSAESLGDSIKIGRRGSVSGTIEVTGKQGHSAYPERARNPLPVLSRIAVALTELPLDRGTAHFQPSNLEVTAIDTGNEAFNVIPARARLKFNARHNESYTAETLANWVRERIGSVDARGCAINFTLAGRPSRAFLSPLSADVDLLGDAIAAVTGRRPAHATFGGTSDARFIADYCPVVECGLVGTTMHQVDENIAIADLEGLTDIYAAFIARFCASGQ